MKAVSSVGQEAEDGSVPEVNMVLSSQPMDVSPKLKRRIRRRSDLSLCRSWDCYVDWDHGYI